MSQLLEATQSECQVQRTLQRIEGMFQEHESLGRYASKLKVTVHESKIVLGGTLPSSDLRQQLVPTIRQAGVLWRIDNNVAVQATTPVAKAS
ncbi:hypothetical protein [Rhodopirellula sp. P2]|uniref:hypothetical protein n=1 Tax=Rhodopirellula sp. P2 TaxID=2127060 RepID=UPI0023677477|nr:hypothetical protein [Rhodopirellula sp. P2]WDQ17740.1 hypothetical protein PSR62_04110 [Rhodopirellula sp. P2]